MLGVEGVRDGGPKTIPVPFQLPSNIYNPSLIKPHYGINDRQLMNPLTDAANDLMTPVIQLVIANQAQKVDRIPIQEEVKPSSKTYKAKPPPRAIPIQQKDQSYPIQPEISIDSDIQLPIHDVYMDYKNLRNIVQPQTPKIKPPKK
jgi:hypothetical protein